MDSITGMHLETLQIIPTDIPHIDWIPVDLVAQAICELSLPREEQQSPGQLCVFNVVNPDLVDWKIFADVLRSRLGQVAQFVTFAESVDRLVRSSPDTMSKTNASSSMKILPFFQHLADIVARGYALQPEFDTTNAIKASRTMAEMQAVNKTLIDLWCDQWRI